MAGQSGAGVRVGPFLLLTAFLVPLAGCGAGEGARPATEGTDSPPSAGGAGQPTVRPGLEVLLSDSLHLVRGKRVGLITNHTGVDRQRRLGIDRLHDHPEVDLIALYSPEHGIRGTAGAGELVDSTVDTSTGLPIHSLYGATRKPTPEMLEGIDVLLFDIQDIGTRYYTYVYTMALAMEAAGEAGIPFAVLDRPNPIGGRLVQGNILAPAFSSFVGMYALPMRHGMTPGELARLFRDHFGVDVELTVVPADGWRRDMLFPDTGLPWIPPSPNMPSLESALHYPGSCLFEGTNVSVGRGTGEAFQQVGAPWLDGDALVAALEGWELEGVSFEAVGFTPQGPADQKFDGVPVTGVRWIVTDPDRYDPTVAALAVLLESRRLGGDQWGWNRSHFDRLAGTDALREELEGMAGLPAPPSPAGFVAEITARWEAERAEFLGAREAALLSDYDPGR